MGIFVEMACLNLQAIVEVSPSLPDRARKTARRPLAES
jgi:hypothetical protein